MGMYMYACVCVLTLLRWVPQRDVAPRHLLRLGTGEAELRREAGAGTALAEGEVFSKQGRVNWSLTRRIKLLSAVSKLGASLGMNKRIHTHHTYIHTLTSYGSSPQNSQGNLTSFQA